MKIYIIVMLAVALFVLHEAQAGGKHDPVNLTINNYYDY